MSEEEFENQHSRDVKRCADEFIAGMRAGETYEQTYLRWFNRRDLEMTFICDVFVEVRSRGEAPDKINTKPPITKYADGDANVIHVNDAIENPPAPPRRNLRSVKKNNDAIPTIGAGTSVEEIKKIDLR